MLSSSKITLAEFLSDSHISPTEESHEDHSDYCDTYENKFDFIGRVAKPQGSYVEAFKESHYLFSSSQSSITSSEDVTGRYDINWLSPDDYISNWEKLSKDEQITFRMLVMSDFKHNSNRYGLKTKNLEAHLLLNLGCDMNNILNSPSCSVRSNLRSPGRWNEEGLFIKGNFSLVCSDNRTIDAKSCRRSIYKFNRSYDPEKLFKSGLVAYQLVIRSDSSYRKISKDDPVESKRRIHDFFRNNATYLSKLVNKKKKILSYVYSHEISVDSILREEYRPHTHSIVFIEKSNPLQEQEEIELIEKEFNSLHSDREMSLERYSKDDSLVPRRAAKFKDIESSIGYLFRAYSLAEGYLREIRSNNIRELNQKTVECYRNLIWLFKGEEANGLKGVRRFNSSYMPERNEDVLYKHPLLQKKKKSNTIKKENSKTYASTRKSSKNKHKDSSGAGSVKSCKSSRVQEDSSRTRTQRRLLSRSAQRVGKEVRSPITGRAGNDAASESKRAAGEYSSAEGSKPTVHSSSAIPVPVGSPRARVFISEQNGEQSSVSTGTDAGIARADCQGKPKHAGSSSAAAKAGNSTSGNSTSGRKRKICSSPDIRPSAPKLENSSPSRVRWSKKPELCTSLSGVWMEWGTEQEERRKLSSISKPRAQKNVCS
jgi:hypothetical protein